MSSDLYGRTQRLELADQNLRSFEAVVLASSPDGIVLSTSAFYQVEGASPRIGEFSSGRVSRPASAVCARVTISI